ncbi:MAG: UDP-2,3-diacylglucosamine diphosphatase [Marinobacterium sp.]|nr:UDP-2,3-diacylglucosamine diphosphatase [Marinobacterium sp.]
MRQIFVSDLHLQNERPDLVRAFLHFLDTDARRADQLYLLGDIFEAWIGDDAPFPGTEPIIAALRNLSDDGVALFFQHGNRDFLVGEQFAEEAGCTLLDDSTVITSADNRPLLLMHGDQLCTDDVEYQKLRVMLRNPMFQQNILAQTVEQRLTMAQQLRDASKEQGSQKSMAIMDVNAEAVTQALVSAETALLLHGHTHRPAVHKLQLPDNTAAQRIVLGDWDHKGWYLEWNDNGFQLIDFNIEGYAD